MTKHLYKPSSPLLKLSKHDTWTLEDAYTGTFICGGIGSGKSSGSGRTIAHAFLRAGFGGLVLCAKPDEADVWRRYCKETGRENSLIVLGGNGNKYFNFLEYELARVDGGSNKTTFALEALLKVYEAMQAADGIKGDESFWRNSVRLLLSHSIDSLYAAYGRVRFPELMRFINSAPRSPADMENPKWRDSSFHYLTLRKIARDPEKPPNANDFGAVLRYFEGYVELDKKTKSNIIATLEAMVMDFQKGDLARLFCTDTNIVPEMSHHGAVIVLDFPLKSWQRGGQIAQHIFKFAWQRAIERRRVEEQTRPCFLWADEYQLFASSYDAEFQSTARSSRACTVYMTQSVPALREAVKSTIPKETIDALLNNFQTAIIHTCRDFTTQEWAANLIGKGLQWRHSETYSTSHTINWSETSGTGYANNSTFSTTSGDSTNSDPGGVGIGRNYTQSNNTSKNQSTNQSTTGGNAQGSTEGGNRQETMDYFVQPSFFGTRLRMGGQRNNFLVDGVIIQGGKTWNHNNSTWLVCSFSQK